MRRVDHQVLFVDDEDRLRFTLHPVLTSTDVVAILDRIVRRISRRLTGEARDDRITGSMRC